MANDKVKVKIFDGLYKEQKAIVTDVLSKKYDFVTVKSGRQSGKSFALDRIAIGLCLLKKRTILWATPTHGQSMDAIVRIENLLRDKLPNNIKKSASDREVEFTNGSKIQYVSADRPDNLRGKHPDYVFLDEYAFFHPGAMDLVIVPYLIANKDMVCVTASTPTGRNDFYDLWLKGEDKKNKTYVNHKLHYTMNPNVNLPFIENQKLTLPEVVFRQEFEGEFVVGSSQVFGDFIKYQGVNSWLNPNSSKKHYYGIDWSSGSGKDETVITIIDDSGKVVYIYECKKENEYKQIDELIPIIKRYNALGYSEDNGLGHTCNTILSHRGIIINRFVTSQSSKADLVGDLIVDLNNGIITLPSIKLCPKLDSEMGTFEVKRSQNGKLSYSHQAGYHDDYVDSLLLANKARKKIGDGRNVYTQSNRGYSGNTNKLNRTFNSNQGRFF